jgi:hypothetical protein
MSPSTSGHLRAGFRSIPGLYCQRYQRREVGICPLPDLNIFPRTREALQSTEIKQF